MSDVDDVIFCTPVPNRHESAFCKSRVSELAQRVVSLVVATIAEMRPRLVHAALSGCRAENENLRHKDNFLSEYDLWMHQHYKERLADFIPSFIYASEEDDPQVVGPDVNPNLCVIVDPLDTSELAVRALQGYTHVMLYSRSLKRPILAVVSMGNCTSGLRKAFTRGSWPIRESIS